MRRSFLGGVDGIMLNKEVIAGLYNERYKEFGRDIRTVGWGKAEDQRLRFDVLFRGLDPRGAMILDVGCGLGDLIPYLEARVGKDFTYVGIDIAEKLVADAEAKFGGPGRRFFVGDIFSVQGLSPDISILSGALSFRTEGIEQYAFNTLSRMFELSKTAASLNFMSKYADFEAEKNQHYQPETVFGWAKSLTRRVNLIHDYPLYEFTVQIFR